MTQSARPRNVVPLTPSSIASQPAERRLRRIFILLAIAAAAMAGLLALLPPAGHDQLWFLLMARRWLQGAPIYGPQIFDSNPPAIVWLSAVPALLSQGLHLPVTFVAKALVLLAEAATALLSLSFLLRAHQSQMPHPSRAPHSSRVHHSWRSVIAAWVGLNQSHVSHSSRSSWRDEWAGGKARVPETPAFLFAAIILFCVIPARDFGQRDQILSFLILPYVLAAAIDFRQHPLLLARTAAAVLAAIGICLKPHHALIPVAIELTLLLSPNLTTSRLRQLFRPEPILILLLGLAYLAAIHHFTPLYFNLALPILHDTYWAIGHLSLAALALQAIQLCLLAAITIALFLLRKPRSQTVLLLLAAASAATLVYFIQGTGWYYQQLPAIALFGAALTLELLDILHARAKRHPLRLPAWATPATAALCVLAIGLTTYFTGSPFTRARAYAPVFADPAVPDPAFFASLPPHTPIAILTTSVEAAMMPVQRFNLTWAQRTDNLWLLPAILRSESPIPNQPHQIPRIRIPALDALQHRWMVQDLTRWHPSLILVARCQDPQVHCQELEDRHDNLLAWFLRDPAFAAVWAHYTYIGSRGGFDAYATQPPAKFLTKPLAVPPPTQ
jgi:hypothetical protein